MSLNVCPAAVVAAPVEVVWANLVQWDRYAGWADVYVECLDPQGPAAVGQVIDFAGKALGRTQRFTFNVTQVDPDSHQFGVHAVFLWGLQVNPHVSCHPIDAVTCRVQYG